MQGRRGCQTLHSPAQRAQLGGSCSRAQLARSSGKACSHTTCCLCQLISSLLCLAAAHELQVQGEVQKSKAYVAQLMVWQALLSAAALRAAAVALSMRRTGCREVKSGYHLEQRYLAEMRQPGDLNTTAVLWHPFRNELVTANTLGHVQVGLPCNRVQRVMAHMAHMQAAVHSVPGQG